MIATIREIVLPRLTCNPKNRNGGTFQYVDIDALDNTRQIIVAPKVIPIDGAPSRARMLIYRGDVLFSLVRPYLKNIAVVTSGLDGEIASTAFCVLRPAKGIASHFLFYQLCQEPFINSIPTYGSSPPAARDEEFLNMAIGIAPVNEQHRVVRKIDELFSYLDTGIAALERSKANLKRYRAAILKAAVDGELTREWRVKNPPSGPAEKLLERILIERRRRWEEEQLAKFAEKGQTPPKDWKHKYREPSKTDRIDIIPLSEGWCWTTIDAIAKVTKLAGFEYTKFVDYDPHGDLPVIKAENVGKDGFKHTNFSRVQSKAINHLTRSRLHGGEVLMVFVGAGVGQVARVPFDQLYFLGPNVSVIKVTDKNVLPEYLEMYLRSPIGFKMAISFTKSVAQPSLSMETIRKIPVVIPPIDEQRIALQKINQYASIGQQTQLQLSVNLTRASRLRQAILKDAFDGNLVPHDPADEPATVLLERIKSEQ